MEHKYITDAVRDVLEKAMQRGERIEIRSITKDETVVIYKINATKVNMERSS